MSIPFWELTASGLIVSLPGIVVTVWLGNRSLRRHVDARTRQQTSDIAALTDQQTGIFESLLQGRRRGRRIR